MNTFEISPFRLEGDVWLILDQTRLPGTEVYLRPETKEDIWHAINTLQVRGAPAIGIAAAYGLWLSVKDFTGSMEEFAKTLHACQRLSGDCPSNSRQPCLGTGTHVEHLAEISALRYHNV